MKANPSAASSSSDRFTVGETEPDLTGFEWRWAAFDALSNTDLYAVLKLRVDVFVVEQKCAYPEIDGQDETALHLLATENGVLAGYLRLIPPDKKNEVALGRIVVAEDYRSRRLGGRLLEVGLLEARRIYPGCSVKLSAQAHLQKFYGRLGFVSVSGEYLEDGIPHVDMLYDTPG